MGFSRIVFIVFVTFPCRKTFSSGICNNRWEENQHSRKSFLEASNPLLIVGPNKKPSPSILFAIHRFLAFASIIA
jgi:hypothetical protein